jgi:hypothetical protein
MVKGDHMVKLIRGIVLVGFVILLAFLIISLVSGGEKFRWLGKEVQRQSEMIGEKADKIREKGEGILKGFSKTKGKIIGATGRKDEASH